MAEKKKRRRLSGVECVQEQNREETNAQILRGAVLRFFGRFDLMHKYIVLISLINGYLGLAPVH